MTIKVFYQDSYQKTLTSEVKKIVGDGIILKQTIYYPLGGGQPGDIGSLNIAGEEYDVTDTRFADNRVDIIHYIDTQAAPEIKPGDRVELQIDWQRRHRLMRMHSSMHLLCSLISAQATGGSVGETESRLDFDLQGEQVDKEQLTIELNRLIERALPVSIGSISDQELDKNPELIRTMSVQPPRGQGSVRTISIKDTDYQPCGGMHVRNTAEIGELLITKLKNKGKQNKRISIALVSP